MAGSGMCTGGRILHHLRHNLGQPGASVLFVGFQSPGTLGRQLVDGAKEVSLFGERVPVRASVCTMGGLSAHAGQDDLLNWFAAVAPSKPRVILTHGEDRAREALGELIRTRHGLHAERPLLGEVVEL
jgi:metallo-beta-lactamase family protein